MKSIILYGSKTKLTNAHKPVHHKTGDPRTPQPEYYVRMAIFNGDIDEALSRSRPMTGETVLNTIPYITQ